MGKGKPRYNPDKPANKYGRWCPYFETYYNGKVGCEAYLDIHDKIEDMECKGNRHNCVKVDYHRHAILKNTK